MVSERLFTLSQELAELSRRGFTMEPQALAIIGALVADIAGDAVEIEGGRRRHLVLIIEKDRQ